MPEPISTELTPLHMNGGGEMNAYAAWPTSPGKHPAIAVIQEAWGLTPDIRDIVERFARLGFAAVSPDLYHGRNFNALDDARAFNATADMAERNRMVDEAATWLTERSFAAGPQFGIVGFCMGGAFALMTASRNPNVAACVSFYGGIRENPDEAASKIKAPVLAFHGSDELERGTQLKDLLQKHGKSVELHIYDGARHGFFNRTKMAVHHNAASYDAWTRSIDFFR